MPPRSRSRAAHAVACLAVLMVAGFLTLLLPPAASATSTTVPELGVASEAVGGDRREKQAQLREARQLAQALRQRQDALEAIDRQAEEHADELEAEAAALAERMARLAALGYTGDLANLTHVLPLGGYHLSAGFGRAGPLWETTHTGLDFGAAAGTPLVAIGDGTVTSVGDAGPYGLRTVLTLEDGTDLWYCHQLTATVEPGQQVEVGQPIGLVGSTGNSTGPHLHLEVRPGGGVPIDPAAWLAALGLAP